MAQKDSLQPLADAMFAAATGAFSTLAGIGATAGDADDGERRRIDQGRARCRRHPHPDARRPGVSVRHPLRESRYRQRRRADAGDSRRRRREMDAMQLSIVAETVAQIATAMGEAPGHRDRRRRRRRALRSRQRRGRRSRCRRSPRSPPPIAVGDSLHTSVTIDFDGLSLSQDGHQAAGRRAGRRRVRRAPARTLPPMPPPPWLPRSPDRRRPAAAAARRPQRPAPEGQAAQFAPMQPTGIRPAAPGQSNLDLVHDVPLEISAVLGQTELSLREVVAMVPGQRLRTRQALDRTDRPLRQQHLDRAR